MQSMSKEEKEQAAAEAAKEKALAAKEAAEKKAAAAAMKANAAREKAEATSDVDEMLGELGSGKSAPKTHTSTSSGGASMEDSKVKVVECVYNGSWEHSPLFGSHESTIHTRTTFDTFQNTGA